MSDVLQMLTAYLAQPIDATTTTITIKNFKDSRGNAITAMIGSLLYATIEPTSQNNQEIISFTGITNLGNGLVQLTGVTRNLGPVPPHTALTADVPHGTGAAVIITDTPQFWNERAAKNKAEVITSIWEFTGRPFLTADVDATDDRQFVTRGQLNRTAFGTPTISGLQLPATAGENLTIRQVAWLDETVGTWKLANASTLSEINGTKKLGIVKSTTTTGNVIASGIQPEGFVSGYSGLTIGLVYVNDAGNISNTVGTNSRPVGVALSATEIIFDPNITSQLSTFEKAAMAGTSGTPSATNKFVTANDESRNYGSVAYAATTTGNDTYVVTLSPAPTSLVDGMIIRVKLDVANTGAATLNVNGLGALSIVTGVSTALITGNIVAGMIGVFLYNSTGTVWQLLNPQTTGSNVSSVASTSYGTSPTHSSWQTATSVTVTTKTANAKLLITSSGYETRPNVTSSTNGLILGYRVNAGVDIEAIRDTVYYAGALKTGDAAISFTAIVTVATAGSNTIDLRFASAGADQTSMNVSFTVIELT